MGEGKGVCGIAIAEYIPPGAIRFRNPQAKRGIQRGGENGDGKLITGIPVKFRCLNPCPGGYGPFKRGTGTASLHLPFQGFPGPIIRFGGILRSDGGRGNLLLNGLRFGQVIKGFMDLRDFRAGGKGSCISCQQKGGGNQNGGLFAVTSDFSVLFHTLDPPYNSILRFIQPGAEQRGILLGGHGSFAQAFIVQLVIVYRAADGFVTIGLAPLVKIAIHGAGQEGVKPVDAGNANQKAFEKNIPMPLMGQLMEEDAAHFLRGIGVIRRQNDLGLPHAPQHGGRNAVALQKNHRPANTHFLPAAFQELTGRSRGRPKGMADFLKLPDTDSIANQAKQNSHQPDEKEKAGRVV